MAEKAAALQKLKQCRKTMAIARFLMGLGLREDSARKLALSGKGWWRLADTHKPIEA